MPNVLTYTETKCHQTTLNLTHLNSILRFSEFRVVSWHLNAVKTFSVIYEHSFLCSQITQTGIRSQIKRAVNLVIAYGHLIFLGGLCGYVWVNILTLPSLTVKGLTLKVLNFRKFTSYCSLKPLWSGMGEVVPACTSQTLHPPSPPTVYQLSWLAL